MKRVVLVILAVTILCAPRISLANERTQETHPGMATPSAPAAWYLYWWYISHGYTFGEWGPTMSEIGWWWH